jgi:hypothetical protein
MRIQSRVPRWIVSLSLFLSAVMSASAAQTQTAGGAGSPGPPPGGTHESPKRGKPGTASPADAMRHARPSDKSGLRFMPREQTPPLEERLQRGQMEEAVAQGRVSDRLEQLHKGLAEKRTENTAISQSTP